MNFPSFCFFIVLTLAVLSIASPTPVNLAARACTTVVPDILQIFSEAAPSTSFPNTASTSGQFTVSQAAGATNRIYQGVGFSNIPAGAYGCELNFFFQSLSEITAAGNPVVNVSTVAKGASQDIVSPNNWTWDDLYASPSPIDVGLFGTVGEFEPGFVHTINSEGCPTDVNGGGNLGFLFSIASWVDGDASVSFNEVQTPLTGVFLTYNC